MASPSGGFEAIIDLRSPKYRGTGKHQVLSKKYSRVVFGNDDPTTRQSSVAHDSMMAVFDPAAIRAANDVPYAGVDCEVVTRRQLKSAPANVIGDRVSLQLHGPVSEGAAALPSPRRGRETVSAQELAARAAAGLTTDHIVFRHEHATRAASVERGRSTVSLQLDPHAALPESTTAEALARPLQEDVKHGAAEAPVFGLRSEQQNHVRDAMRHVAPPVFHTLSTTYSSLAIVGTDLAPELTVPRESERQAELREAAERGAAGEHTAAVAAGVRSANRVVRGGEPASPARATAAPPSGNLNSTLMQFVMSRLPYEAPAHRAARRPHTAAGRDNVHIGDTDTFSPQVTFKTSTAEAYDQHQRGGLDRPYRPLTAHVATPEGGAMRASMSHLFLGGEAQPSRELSPKSAARKASLAGQTYYAQAASSIVFGSAEITAASPAVVARPTGKRTDAHKHESRTVAAVLNPALPAEARKPRPMRAQSAFARRSEFLSPTVYDLVSGAAPPLATTTGKRLGRGQMHPTLWEVDESRAGVSLRRHETGDISEVIGNKTPTPVVHRRGRRASVDHNISAVVF